MPNWQPVTLPGQTPARLGDFCPTCGVYWECECSTASAEDAKARFIPELSPDPLGDELMRGFANVETKGTALTVEDMQAAVQGIKEAPNGIFADESYFYKAGGWPNAS